MTPRDLALHICEVLSANGHQAYLVGGCVRDLELGREPADFDVATDAEGNPVPGAPVTFSAPAGGPSTAPSPPTRASTGSRACGS